MPDPNLPASFEWTLLPTSRGLVCRPLAKVAQHVFTCRERQLPDSVSPAHQGLWAALATVFGVSAEQVARLTQVHGTHVVRVPEDTSGAGPSGTWGRGDALVTDDPELVIAIKTADCVPILLADGRRGVVAAVHAGWRGTAAAMCAAAVRALETSYGSAPSDLLAAIGPSIGPCCYEVGTEVFDRFIKAGTRPDEVAEWFSVLPKPAQAEGLGLGVAARAAQTAATPGKLWLDTWQANADQLAAAGVPRDQIHVSRLCTACFPGMFHSYRVEGARAGRMVGAIRRR
jgi:YfiH family protein